jgi:predicted TIM-barrel fold metal-dependent hydrolase
LSGPDFLPLPAIDDEEGARVPDALPPIIDAHVHLFPDKLFEAIWRWFDAHAWPIRHKLHAKATIAFLRARGIDRFVALHYAHKPGIARSMNRAMAELVREEPGILGSATVFPGEEGAAEILKEAFALGLRAVKMHCHVQCVSPDDPSMHAIYATCAEADVPLVLHAGRAPSSPHYKCDVLAICAADRIERVLRDHPRLRLIVPHLGSDEYDPYLSLLERHDNLWLDTTMAMAAYFPLPDPLHIVRARPDRIMYGTDFPNLPYAWDRELKGLLSIGLRETEHAAVLGQNARHVFGFE